MFKNFTLIQSSPNTAEFGINDNKWTVQDGEYCISGKTSTSLFRKNGEPYSEFIKGVRYDDTMRNTGMFDKLGQVLKSM